MYLFMDCVDKDGKFVAGFKHPDIGGKSLRDYAQGKVEKHPQIYNSSVVFVLVDQKQIPASAKKATDLINVGIGFTAALHHGRLVHLKRL